jgi:hypothetical protein
MNTSRALFPISSGLYYQYRNHKAHISLIFLLTPNLKMNSQIEEQSEPAIRSLESLMDSPRSPTRRTRLPREMRRPRDAYLPRTPDLSFDAHKSCKVEGATGFQQESHGCANFCSNHHDLPPKRPARSRSVMRCSESLPRKPTRHLSIRMPALVEPHPFPRSICFD